MHVQQKCKSMDVSRCTAMFDLDDTLLDVATSLPIDAACNIVRYLVDQGVTCVVTTARFDCDFMKACDDLAKIGLQGVSLQCMPQEWTGCMPGQCDQDLLLEGIKLFKRTMRVMLHHLCGPLLLAMGDQWPDVCVEPNPSVGPGIFKLDTEPACISCKLPSRPPPLSGLAAAARRMQTPETCDPILEYFPPYMVIFNMELELDRLRAPVHAYREDNGGPDSHDIMRLVTRKHETNFSREDAHRTIMAVRKKGACDWQGGQVPLTTVRTVSNASALLARGDAGGSIFARLDAARCVRAACVPLPPQPPFGSARTEMQQYSQCAYAARELQPA